MIKLFLPKFWYKRYLISYLLLPFSLIYIWLTKLRRFYYQHFFVSKFPLPIVIVGNITVGGTGKTMLVIYLAQLLKQHGYKPGIISRGYGRKYTQGSVVVTATSRVEEAGDEALLIARKIDCPIVVNIDRLAAAKKLLEEYKCDVVISDDGLQHYKLPRDIEIAVIDAKFVFGNGFCLPSGPLREPLDRLKTVDFIVKNFNTDRLTKDNTDNKYSMVLEPVNFRNIKNTTIIKEARDFTGEAVHAVAGIGMPQKFFATLRQLNLDIIEHPFQDHHPFSIADFSFGTGAIIMTEKDAVKCQSIANDNFWCMEVKAVLNEKFTSDLLTKLKGVKP